MSVWSTKSFNKDRNYIVIKHNLPNMNYVVGGVKFRASYAVVEKDSKTYFALRKFSVLKNAKEFPLTFLRKLPFVSRTKDIEIVYGREVYRSFIMAEQAALEAEHLKPESTKCKATTNQDKLCENERLPESPSGYCVKHVLSDPKLPELGIELLKFVPKEDKRSYREKIIRQLGQLQKEGKF